MRNPNILALSAAALLAITSLCQAQTAVVATTTTTDGTISEFSPETIVVRSETSPEPIRYTWSKTTTYVDDEGQPVSMEIVKSGLPVTVHYIREGDRTVANRVIVHRKKSVTTTAPAVVEKQTVITPAPAPVLEEKSTSTTTTTTSK